MATTLKSLFSATKLKKDLYRGRMQPRHRFADLVKSHLRQDSWVLDAGCGAGSGLKLRGQCAFVVGYDAGDDVFQNVSVDAAVKGDLQFLGLPSESFDLIVCNWVLEHLQKPLDCFLEFARVLKPGGAVILLTPNMFHYSILISRLTPYGFHEWFLARLGMGTHDHCFPTYYRANTPRSIRRLMCQAGLREGESAMVEGTPSYLAFSSLSFLLGAGYERVISSWSGFGRFRSSIVASFRKPYGGNGPNPNLAGQTNELSCGTRPFERVNGR